MAQLAAPTLTHSHFVTQQHCQALIVKMSQLDDINPEDCSIEDLKKWFRYIRSRHTVAWKKAVAGVEDFMDSPTSMALSEGMALIGKADETAENYQYWALCITETLQAGSASTSDTEEAGGYRIAASEATDKLRDLKKKFRAAAETFEESLKARAAPPPCPRGPPPRGGGLPRAWTF